MLGIAAVVAAYAAAAPLGVGSDHLGSGSDAVNSCDTNSVTTSYGLIHEQDPPDPGFSRVISVTVGNLATLCNGETISVTLTDAGGAVLGSGTHAGGGASRLVTISGPGVIDAADVAKIDVAITGDDV